VQVAVAQVAERDEADARERCIERVLRLIGETRNR